MQVRRVSARACSHARSWPHDVLRRGTADYLGRKVRRRTASQVHDRLRFRNGRCLLDIANYLVEEPDDEHVAIAVDSA